MTDTNRGGPALDPEPRALLARVADALLPGDHLMPSASAAGVHTRWIDEALRLRPDLRPALDRCLELAARLDAAEALRTLAREDASLLDSVGTLVAGGYFMDERVRRAIGYPGQEAVPAKDDVGTYLDMLAAVVERGPVYRPVPEEAQ